MTSYKRVYGLDWPVALTDFQIDLQCWAFNKVAPYCHGNLGNPHELFIKAMRRVLSEDEYKLSAWSEQHIYDWTHESDIITWGCASSSKSWDYGMLALFQWYALPGDTIILLVTTTKPALNQRTFAAVAYYHRLLKAKFKGMFPGKLLPSTTALVQSAENDEVVGTKSGILGLAVNDGPVEEATAFLRGRHAKVVILIADELSQLRPAVVDPELLINLQIGTSVFKFVGLTNIHAFDDLAGRNSVPIGGWSSVNMDTMTWRTKRGVVRRHDGRLSPAIVEPCGAQKYPHLLNPETLSKIVEQHGGESTPGFFRMIRAWPPPVELSDSVITPPEALQWKMRDAVVWKGPTTPVAGLDPGYGGDKCILALGSVGETSEGVYVIHYDRLVWIKIDATLGIPVLSQILQTALPELRSHGVTPEHLAIDDSGPQSVADVFYKEFGPGIMRVSFGSRPTELPVSVYNPAPASKYYANRGTEIVYTIRLYAQYGQIRGFPEDALSQITRRLVLPKQPRQLQSKRDYKQATGLGSPDDLDACALLAAVAREVVGLAPGATSVAPSGTAAPSGFMESNQAFIDRLAELDAGDERYIQNRDTFEIDSSGII